MGSAYLEKVFLQIVNMSLTGIYCIIAVLLVRLLLKKQPKIFSYVLWLSVLFRLVCPVSFESPLSAFHMTDMSVVTSNGVQSISRITGRDVWAGENNGTENGIAENDEIAKNGGSTENAGTVSKSESGKSSEAIKNSESTKNTKEVKNELLTKVWFAAEAIWLAGIIGMLIYAGVSAVLLQKKLKSVEKREGYYIVEHLETPFVFGLMFPRIYLPTELSEREITYILEHERTHIRRHDYLIKPLAFLVVCIHWFNPFVWLAFFCMTKDMEMSCDEAVLKKLGKEIKRDYSASLLNLACGRRFLSGSPLAFGEGEVKGRIKNILNYKKPGFWGILLAVAVVTVTGVVLISNPMTAKEGKTESGERKGERREAGSGENSEEDIEAGGAIGEALKANTGNETVTEKLPVYQTEEEEQLKELLASYGNLNSEEYYLSSGNLEYCNDILVEDNKYGDISNLERWVTFYNHAEAGEADALLLLRFTVEGDAILSYLSYENGTYYHMIDDTRDKWGPQTYLSAQFSYLKEYADNGYLRYYLSGEENLSSEQIMSYHLSSAVSVDGIDLFLEFPYTALEQYLGTEVVKKMEAKDLEACITKAVLNENQSSYHMAEFQTEAHYNLKIVENGNKTTVYSHILYAEYNSLMEKESGSYTPVALTFSQNEEGEYSLEEYWIPEDGSYYKSSIEKKFPEDIWEEALAGQSCINVLEKECEERAEEFFSHQEP